MFIYHAYIKENEKGTCAGEQHFCKYTHICMQIVNVSGNKLAIILLPIRIKVYKLVYQFLQCPNINVINSHDQTNHQCHRPCFIMYIKIHKTMSLTNKKYYLSQVSGECVFFSSYRIFVLYISYLMFLVIY